MEVGDIAFCLIEGGQVDVDIISMKEVLTIAGGVEIWQPTGSWIGCNGAMYLVMLPGEASSGWMASAACCGVIVGVTPMYE